MTRGVGASHGKRGIVYVMVNPCIAGLVKIGRTTRDPHERARELSASTAVPMQFEVIFDAIVADAAAAEQLLHRQFSKYRLNPQREFFRISPYDAIKAVQAVAERFASEYPELPEEREILPDLDRTMRRWLRRDIVSVIFLQYTDLCALKVTFQPDPLLDVATETIFDLRVYGEYDEGEFDDDLTFSPQRSIDKNISILADEFDAYSLAMTGCPLLDPDIEDEICRRHQEGAPTPLRPSWCATSRTFSMWGPEDEWRPLAERLGLLAAPE